MKFTTISERVTRGGDQTQIYTYVFKTENHKYKIKINNDSYMRQSYGAGYVLKDDEWHEIVHLFGDQLEISGGGYHRNGSFLPYFEDREQIREELFEILEN